MIRLNDSSSNDNIRETFRRRKLKGGFQMVVKKEEILEKS